MNAKKLRIALGRRSAPAALAAALGLIAGAAPALLAGQGQERADYEAAHKFSEENLKKALFDLTVNPNWIPGGDRFWYRWETSAGVRFIEVDPAARKIRPLFDSAALAKDLERLLGKPFDPAHLPIDALAFSPDGKTAQFAAGGAVLELARPDGRLRKVPDAAVEDSPFTAAQMKIIRDYTNGGTLRGYLLYSPDNRWAVFARDHNLFLIEAGDPAKKEFPLTSDGEAWHTFDLSNEDGRLKGRPNPAFVTWMPDGHRFFIKRSDRRKVRDLWLLQPLAQPGPTLLTYKNALAGDEFIDQSELWVFDCEKKTAVRVKADKWKDQSIGGKEGHGGVFAAPGSDEVFFIRTDRTWSRIDFCAADPRTGEVRTIIAEEQKPNVTPTSSQVKILDGGREIIWWSDRSGWGHYYLYDGSGRLKNAITTGPFCGKAIVDVDPVRRTLYFTATGKDPALNPYYESLCRVGLDGSGLRCLTPENANHGTESLALAPSRRFFVDNFSRVDLAPRAVVRDAEGRKVLDLDPPDLSRLEALGWKPPETFKVKAADRDTDLFGVIWTPFRMEAGRKYPVVLFTYPGPISEVVPKNFNPLEIPVTGLAQLGFAVVMFGNRGGSAERAKWYNAFGYGNLRDFSLPDKKFGLEQLGALYPFLDLGRVGVMGGSGGGFQATSLMFTYPDFFKVGVCWAGNNDNRLMENYWPELNHGLKEIQENGQTRFVIDAPTNLDLAKNLKGHFLIMHGLQDSRVHPANTYRVVQALIEANKPFDMYIIPDEQHQFTRAKYQPYLLRVIWQYFAHYLLGDPRSAMEVFSTYGGPVLNSPWGHN